MSLGEYRNPTAMVNGKISHEHHVGLRCSLNSHLIRPTQLQWANGLRESQIMVEPSQLVELEIDLEEY